MHVHLHNFKEYLNRSIFYALISLAGFEFPSEKKGICFKQNEIDVTSK